MAVQLVQPSLIFEKSYKEYIAELGHEERYPFPMDWEFNDFSMLVTRLEEFSEGIDIPEGFVPSTTYWLVEDNELVGVSNLRHFLNDRIRNAGGHIGLGIRPSQRGNGYGTSLLRLTIEKALERGISEIHVHCHKSNSASVRMIQSAGCKLASELELEVGGEVVQRFIHGTR